MSSASKRIDGFQVEVEVEMDGGQPVSSCFISKGKCSSSLRLAQELGGVEGCDGACFEPMSESTLAKIEEFAYDNGY